MPFTIHPLVVLLMKLSCSVPESVKRFLQVSDYLNLREGGHLPLQKLFFVIDGLYA